MSDEAKVAYLKEKINEAKKRGWETVIFEIVGVIAFLFGWNSWDIGFMVLGASLWVIGLVTGLHYNSQKNKFMEQLRDIGFKTTDK